MSKYSEKHKPAPPICSAKNHDDGGRCGKSATQLAHTIAGLFWHCDDCIEKRRRAGKLHDHDPRNDKETR